MQSSAQLANLAYPDVALATSLAPIRRIEIVFSRLPCVYRRAAHKRVWHIGFITTTHVGPHRTPSRAVAGSGSMSDNNSSSTGSSGIASGQSNKKN